MNLVTLGLLLALAAPAPRAAQPVESREIRLNHAPASVVEAVLLAPVAGPAGEARPDAASVVPEGIIAVALGPDGRSIHAAGVPGSLDELAQIIRLLDVPQTVLDVTVSALDLSPAAFERLAPRSIGDSRTQVWGEPILSAQADALLKAAPRQMQLVKLPTVSQRPLAIRPPAGSSFVSHLVTTTRLNADDSTTLKLELTTAPGAVTMILRVSREQSLLIGGKTPEGALLVTVRRRPDPAG